MKRKRDRSKERSSIEPEARLVRQILTPEGAEFQVRLASFAERGGALLIDLVIILLTLIVGQLAIFTMTFATGSDIAGAMWGVMSTLFFFILRAFYFTGFEMSRRNATPGKRLTKLRVIARNGGQLLPAAVFTRNVLREIELFLPAYVLLSGPGSGATSGWLSLALIVWLGGFVLFPLFNRDRMRVGDLVAGTWVIRTPRARLGQDFGAEAMSQESRFTAAQLGIYGEHELQTLETVLREATPDTVKAVASRIRSRCGLEPFAKETDLAFLAAYYKALRRHLESRLIMGNRKTDKFDIPDQTG